MTERKKDSNEEKSKVKTFAVPFALKEIKESVYTSLNTATKPSKDQIISQAFKFHSQGKVKEAAKYYQYCINQGFIDTNIFSNYGIILKDIGKLKDAEILFRKAIELRPSSAEAHSNLGNVLIDLDQLDEAEIYTRKAIKIKPNFPEALSNLGNILRRMGKLEEAEIVTCKSIEISPNSYQSHYNLGVILKDLGKPKEAELSTRKAIEINPNYSQAYLNLGNILKESGQIKEAEISTRKAIEINPNSSQAYLNLGSILKSYTNLEKLKEAELSTRKSIEINPNQSQAYLNLGNILKESGKLNDSEKSTRKAIQITPNNPEAYFNLALLKLLQEDYSNGLEYYEFRFKKKPAVFLYGTPIIKRTLRDEFKQGSKLLVISEQAPGDIIFYMRYVLALKERNLNVSFCAPKKLHSLIKDSEIDSNPISPEECNLINEGEWIPLQSLLRYFCVSPNNPVINHVYIKSKVSLKLKWHNILSKEKKPIIGINWQGSKEFELNSYPGRSIPLEKFSILLEKNDISFVSFQKGYGSDQLAHCSFKDNFVECQDRIDEIWDYSETAAIIDNCDLIITIDCSIAPLAAGMGKEVWLMLKKIPFWTWGLESERTFWYPTMRLFRQKGFSNWDEVMERISIELNKFIKNKF